MAISLLVPSSGIGPKNPVEYVEARLEDSWLRWLGLLLLPPLLGKDKELPTE